jgi:hypothetical protein
MRPAATAEPDGKRSFTASLARAASNMPVIFEGASEIQRMLISRAVTGLDVR